MESLTTTTIGALDFSFWFIFWISAGLLAGITVVMVYFVVKYSRKRHPIGEDIEGNFWLETLWTAIPIILVLAMFYYGWSGDQLVWRVPSGAMVVRVGAQMWSWQFEYENGKMESELYVPVNKPVKLLINSRDVNHGFFIPAFGLKQDAIPGREHYIWFEARVPGEYDIQCSQYCGTRHSEMLSKVKVLPQEQFHAWYNTITPIREISGEQLLKVRGCLSCHSTDGSRVIGPTFKGLFASKVEISEQGRESTVTADEEYLAESILSPDAKVVKGFAPGKMPSQEGVLKEGELQLITEAIKKLQ